MLQYQHIHRLCLGFSVFDAVNTSDIPQTAHKHYNKSYFCAQQKMTHVRTRLVSAAALQRNSTGGVCHGVCNL